MIYLLLNSTHLAGVFRTIIAHRIWEFVALSCTYVSSIAFSKAKDSEIMGSSCLLFVHRNAFFLSGTFFTQPLGIWGALSFRTKASCTELKAAGVQDAMACTCGNSFMNPCDC